MKPFNIISLVLPILLPILNIGIVFAIVKIDNFFLISLVYPAIFGVVLPLILLVAYWILAGIALKNPAKQVLPWIVSLMIVLCGVGHFAILVIASASV